MRRGTRAAAGTDSLPAVDPRRRPPGGREARSSARTRRRFARRQWRRRWLTWKPALVVVLAVAVGATGVWLVFFSSVLALETVQVTGVRTLTADQVRRASGVSTGGPLARVDVGDIRKGVAALAPVGGVEVRRQWPHDLVISVDERVPVAVVEIGGTLRSLDADGEIFGRYDKAPTTLPRVETAQGTASAALREAATVVAAVPGAIARRVDYIEVATVDQISLVLRDGRRVVWGSAEDSTTKAEVLSVLLRQPAEVYDVSVPSRPTTSQQQPAAE